MAGRRRGTGRPVRRTVRHERRTARLNQALAQTADPRERIAIAVDHYRAALQVWPDPEGTERVVALLIKEGDRLYRKAKEATNVRDGQ